MLEIDDKRFEIVIERKRIHNIYLRVEDNTVKVTAPYHVSDIEIYKFVDSKRKWIYKCSSLKDRESKLLVNDSIFYKGRKYNLFITSGNKSIKFDEDSIYIRCRSGSIEDALKVFYEYGKKVILNYVSENQDKYLKVLEDYGYYQKPIYNVKYLKSMWGCCYDRKNTINLSVRLIHFDPLYWEAILWHELLHFIIPNHSKRFHQVLESKMPRYKEIISKLY